MKNQSKNCLDVVKKFFYSKVKNNCPDQEGKDRTNEILKLVIVKNGRQLTEL